MYYSLFEIFAVGIGPSSSHTVGPMKAARRYVENLGQQKGLENVGAVKVDLYGSLALTGVGHGTLNAVIYGLLGLEAATLDLEENYIGKVKESRQLKLGGGKEIAFDPEKDIRLQKDTFLPEHSNGMKFSAFDREGKPLLEEVYFSVGGGTIARQDEMARRVEREPYDVPYSFDSCNEMVELCKKHGLTIADMVLKNEEALRSPREVKSGILRLVGIMQEAVTRGIHAEGVLPGGLGLNRRAPEMYRRLEEKFFENDVDPLMIVDWVNLWAFAVAEENASGGKIVTAPTMGAAGIVPAVMRYYQRFALSKSPYEREKADIIFMATASAICSLYRANASISGAEVGCQGEVGVACSMAAAGMTAVLGGSLSQIENAAEIAMEHNLGLTCDPVRGLVQIPCIERNAMAAIKAINASRLAMRGTGNHMVSLDSIIKTMYETGLNLSTNYKETSLAGLAVNVVTC